MTAAICSAVPLIIGIPLAQLLLSLETMATAVEQSIPVQPRKVIIIEGVHKISEELNALGEALSIKHTR